MTYDFGDVGEARRRTMRAIESEGTEPEEQAREALVQLGVEFEDQPRFGRWRPDFLLEDGTVLQVMGCFWHGCPRHGGRPGSNEDYWLPKLEANLERDKRRRRELLALEQVDYVFWVWEHDDIPERVAALCEARGLL